MPSYCTVCGVKLTAKNRISYRPSSCRDCELERKRLYSLKRKLQKEQENAAKGAKTSKIKTKSKEEKKKTIKTKVVKGTSATKAKIVTKTPTKTKTAAKSNTATRAKRSNPTKVTAKKTNAAKTKAVVLEKETKAKTKTKTAAKAKATASKVKAKTTTVKTKATEKETKAKAKKIKAEESTKKIKVTAKKEETKPKETKVSAKQKSAVKEEKKEANPFVALPSYIKDSAKTKVKKRRLSKDKKSSSTSLKELTSLSSEGDASHIFALGKELTEEDLLRAPSETPWDSSSFKIVNGSFVEHGVEDQEESRGPSPEEIKNIIEKIRLEHKTRRS